MGIYIWIIARAQKAKEKLYITSINLSSANDSIIREKMIVILETILDKIKMNYKWLSNF